MQKLPVEAAKDVLQKYDLDQVILLAREPDIVHVVTFGKSDLDAGIAALDGEKLRRVLAASPPSLEDALEAALHVRPKDIAQAGIVEDLVQVLEPISRETELRQVACRDDTGYHSGFYNGDPFVEGNCPSCGGHGLNIPKRLYPTPRALAADDLLKRIKTLLDGSLP